MINPEQNEAPALPSGFLVFSHAQTAKEALPELSLLDGTVHNFSEFHKKPREVLIDFHDLGVIAYTFQKIIPSSQGVSDHLLPPWLDYVRSNELWGPQGKWTRFHQRLIDLFENHQLLLNGSLGQYSLKTTAKKLENFGIVGTDLKSSYDLHLSWTFSLSDLEKIETIIVREFECIS